MRLVVLTLDCRYIRCGENSLYQQSLIGYDEKKNIQKFTVAVLFIRVPQDCCPTPASSIFETVVRGGGLPPWSSGHGCAVQSLPQASSRDEPSAPARTVLAWVTSAANTAGWGHLCTDPKVAALQSYLYLLQAGGNLAAAGWCCMQHRSST
jgi:hypothetical protein